MAGLTTTRTDERPVAERSGLDAVRYLDGVLSVSELVRRQTDRAELAEAVADSIARHLGWQTVAVNLLRPERGDFVVAACAGPADAREALLGASSPAEDWHTLMREAEFVEGVYFVPAGRHTWDGLSTVMWVPASAGDGGSDAWDAEDALLVPLRSSDGLLIGVLSVDEPLSGRRPSSTECAVLAAFCLHLATALEIAWLNAAQRQRSAALDRVVELSELARTNSDPAAVLAEVVSSACASLGLTDVEAVLLSDGGLQAAAKAGDAEWFNGRSRAELERALERGESRDGVVILRADPHESTLACALTDLDGRTIGALTATAPEQPAEDESTRRRLLRTFADVAQAAVASSSTQALRISEARKDAILTSSLDAIMSVDADSRIVEFNPAGERTFGRRREDVIGQDMAELIIPARLRAAHRAGLTRYLQGRGRGTIVGSRIEVPAMRADGSEFPAEIAVVRIESEGPAAFTAYLRDITERRQAQAELERQRDAAHYAATHDSRTGLLSLVGLREAYATADRAELAVLTIAFAGLSSLAEAFGQSFVDDLVRMAARELGEPLAADEPFGCFNARTFAVLTSRDRAEGLARRYDALLTNPVVLDGISIQPQYAIGAAAADTDDFDELLRRAAVARSGTSPSGQSGSVLRYYDSVRDTAGERIRFASDLRHAIAGGALELHYQPLFGTRGGGVKALEALVRWRREDGRLVPPLDFVPLAETTGLIAPLGAWVADEACRQIAAWRAAGLAVPPVAINISPYQLGHHDVPTVLSRALERHGVAPADLGVEVTEAALQRGSQQIHRLLAALREMGIRSALDDFGADYSSLSRLATLPFRSVKVDRGFLADVPQDARAAGFLEAIVALARALNVVVTIEGVERREQLEFIDQLDVELVQGYLLGRPVPPSELEPLLLPSPR